MLGQFSRVLATLQTEGESLQRKFTKHLSDLSCIHIIVVNPWRSVAEVMATKRTLIVSELDERNCAHISIGFESIGLWSSGID
jgi:hypothetical protein